METHTKGSVLIKAILNKALKGKGLSREDALRLLTIHNEGPDFESLLSAANELTRKQFNNQGEVHAQIGLNWDKCHNNCQFCIFSEALDNVSETKYLTQEEVIAKAREFEQLKVGSISLMSTADYDFEEYLKMGRAVADSLRYKTPLFANWGDLDFEQAKAVKKAGFTYYYHALRLREGEVTGIAPEVRIQTIKNAHRAGLLVGSCLEPIGPEHSYEEILDLLEIMGELNISWMATMKRIGVKGSPLNVHGEISDEEFAKITAVTRLFYGNKLFTMAAHEPKDICMRAGANFLVTEIGTNPRDDQVETSTNRGRDVKTCISYLESNRFKVYTGLVNPRYLWLSIKNRNFKHFWQLLKNQWA